MKSLLENWNNFLTEQKSFTDKEKIALVIFGEARGESNAGKRAVLHVAMNRAKHEGKSVLEVMQEPGQFSILNDNTFADIYKEAQSGDIPKKKYAESLEIVSNPGKDITGGSTHYLTTELYYGKRKWWADYDKNICWVPMIEIGKHVFGIETGTYPPPDGLKCVYSIEKGKRKYNMSTVPARHDFGQHPKLP
jgi:spore germination cell wall hydrolase CwlJ-like protein